MDMRKLRGATAATIVIALGVAGTAAMSVSAAPRRSDAKPGQSTIRIRANFKKQKLFFDGPKKVEKGSKLRILDTTDPTKVGPHTFTLVKESHVPKTKKQVNDCGRLISAVCKRAVMAHKVNFKTGEVGKPNVDPGKSGWDKSYGKKGDSTVLEAKGDSKTRRVSAKAGTKLYYICLVHPFMHGSFKVTR
jgi:hypothetical protein